MFLNEAKKQVIIWHQKQPPEFYKEVIYRGKHKLQKCVGNNEAYVEI